MAGGTPAKAANRSAVIVGLALVALVALLKLTGLPTLDRLGLLLFDSYQRAAPREYQDAPVRVVDIDDESIRRLGQWPWPRTEVARLTDRLGKAGASVVAFDVVFSEPDRTSPARLADQMARGGASQRSLDLLRNLPDNDAELARTMAANRVVLGYFLVNDRLGPPVETKAGVALGGTLPNAVPEFGRAIESLAQLRQASAGSGTISLAADGDGILRSVPLVARQGGQLLPSLSLEALRVAQGAGSVMVKASDASGETQSAPGRVVAVKAGDFELPTTDSGALWLHWTKPVAERVIPAWKVLDGSLTDEALSEAVSGRIVFVGAGAIGLRDLISTPLGNREMGVMAHAQVAEQAVLGHFLLRPDWATGLEMALLLALGIGLAFALPRLGAAKGAVLVVLAIALMLAGSWLAFSRYLYLLDPTYPIIALGLVYTLQTVLVFYREERRRAYIHSAFDRYLSPELVKRIAADPGRLELGGEEREMTVLFTDVRQFSRISEHLGPKDLIGFLIALLTPLCDVLLARKATIDKFIGDAVLAFWNAPLDDPDQHRNAARAALEMMTKLDALNVGDGRQEGQPWPGPVHIGIGMSCGTCCVGNMGTAQRLSYSLIGDTVNLASRLEGLTKFYGVPILIGDALREHLPDFAAIEVDRVRVVGRDKPEQIHALLGDETLGTSAPFQAFCSSHQAMLAAYRGRDWDAARKLLVQLKSTATSFGLKALYALYAERFDRLQSDPPAADWDGLFVAEQK